MSTTKRETHKQALRQLLDRYGFTNLRQERGQLLDRERLIDEILRVNDRYNNPSLDETLNSGNGSYKP